MLNLLFWAFTAIVAAALALFAASNRESVALAWWPLGFVLDVPLYLALLGAVLLGVLIGALAAWNAGRSWRRRARRRGRRIAALERELAVTQAQLPSTAENPAPALPVRRTG